MKVTSPSAGVVWCAAMTSACGPMESSSVMTSCRHPMIAVIVSSHRLHIVCAGDRGGGEEPEVEIGEEDRAAARRGAAVGQNIQHLQHLD